MWEFFYTFALVIQNNGIHNDRESDRKLVHNEKRLTSRGPPFANFIQYLLNIYPESGKRRTRCNWKRSRIFSKMWYINILNFEAHNKPTIMETQIKSHSVYGTENGFLSSDRCGWHGKVPRAWHVIRARKWRKRKHRFVERAGGQHTGMGQNTTVFGASSSSFSSSSSSLLEFLPFFIIIIIARYSWKVSPLNIP